MNARSKLFFCSPRDGTTADRHASTRDAMAVPADATGTKTFHEDEGAGFWLAALVLALFAAFFYKLRKKSAAES